tara:strand:+ start:103 stop:1779 length:1677 start_codon:yes stop_codon:yes gene_type:complete
MNLIRRYRVIILFITIIVAGIFSSSSLNKFSEFQPHSYISILPALIAILLALFTHQAHLSIFIGIWFGSSIIARDPFHGIARSIDTYLVQSLTDHGHASILIFTIAFGGLIGVISSNGGLAGGLNTVSKYATSNRRSQLVTVLMGYIIFFDDYANTLLVGNMMRPFTDRAKISREKLSYLVDSTAAPVASLALISSWTIFQMSLLDSPFKDFNIKINPYFTFLKSIPFSFYSILTLVFVFINVLTKKEFGPMFAAEERSLLEGKVISEDAKPLFDPNLIQEKNNAASHWSNAFLPIAAVVLFTIGGILITGLSNVQNSDSKLYDIVGASDPYASLIWGSCFSSLFAIGLSIWKKLLSLEEALESWVNGVRSVVLACIILVLAWTIGSVCKDIKTADYLVNISSDVIEPAILPFITFLTASIISFATGSSWATMSILVPVFVPMAINLINLSPNEAVQSSIFLATFASVLSGSVFGDHCSPISDTTILSSTASSSDHIDHVKTQIPYSLTVGIISMFIGYIGVGIGLSLVIIFIISILSIFFIIYLLGKPINDLKEMKI